MNEVKEFLALSRKLVSGLVGPDMWKYLAHKNETDGDMYFYDHGRHIDQ